MLPSYCKEHQQAEILHEWDKTIYSIRGGESGNPLNHNHHYYCAVCRCEVCSPEEFDNRQKSAQQGVHPTVATVATPEVESNIRNSG